MSDLWRIQAHWTVSGQDQSYAPVFEKSEEAARAAAREIEATLSHFSTLEVRVDAVSEEVASEELERQRRAQAASLSQTRHAFVEPTDDKALCGVPLEQAKIKIAIELFQPGGNACPACAERVQATD
jgi:hypothetical protein